MIKIIRQENTPKLVLMQCFTLTDIQAEAILELKLRHLAKLEETFIRQEQENLAQEQRQLEVLLNSSTKLNKM